MRISFLLQFYKCVSSVLLFFFFFFLISLGTYLFNFIICALRTFLLFLLFPTSTLLFFLFSFSFSFFTLDFISFFSMHSHLIFSIFPFFHAELMRKCFMVRTYTSLTVHIIQCSTEFQDDSCFFFIAHFFSIELTEIDLGSMYHSPNK